MNENEPKHYYVECDCGHNDHLVKFTYVPPDDYDCGSVYTSIQLSPVFGFFKRIWVATQYIFGHGSRFGHWDCCIINYPALRRLKVFIDECVIESEKDPRAKHLLSDSKI